MEGFNGRAFRGRKAVIGRRETPQKKLAGLSKTGRSESADLSALAAPKDFENELAEATLKPYGKP